MFRAVPAQWFEQLIAKPMLARAVEALAETGAVEFEFVESEEPALQLAALRERLTPYDEIVRRYAEYLPAPVLPGPVAAERLESVITRNLRRLAEWKRDAEPLVSELETLLQQSRRLSELLDFLQLVDHTPLDLGALKEAAPALETRLFVLPPDSDTPDVARQILHLRVEDDSAVYLLTLGTRKETEETERALTGLEGRGLALPEWMSGRVPDAVAVTEKKRSELEHDIRDRRDRLAGIARQHRTGEALGELRRLDWLVQQLEGVPVGEYFARLTGWTSDSDGRRLRLALEQANLPTVVFLTRHPEDKVPPTLVRNPVWIRPFEFFGRLMGTPGSVEADPSLLLAFVAPLMFGFMFGDVGHGLVILALGILLRKRWPPMAMLISGGVSAIVFGFLYGSVFTFEHLIPALWIAPFEEPLTILFLPMVFGAFLLILGMTLNGLGHFWERRLGFWLRCEAGILLAYVMLALSLVDTQYLIGVVLGIVWHFTGNIWAQRDMGLAALGDSVVDFFEYTLQLVVNTISFVRVGAFALAHAGLGATVFSLADSTDNTFAAATILIVGNVTIIGLEGLVVSVQTTRLLLFEFFIRFMKAGGRPFKPVLPPDYESIRSKEDK